MLVPDDLSTERARRDDMVLAGHRGDSAAAHAGLIDPHPLVRASALGALARMGELGLDEVLSGLGDVAPSVRRRACRESAGISGRGSRSTLPVALRRALADSDPLVVESACWALGERKVRDAVGDLSSTAGTHPDTRCREAAVAALGAIGDQAGLGAVLAALGDKPTVRRRATVALAAFGGPEVDEALSRCLTDHDWQVRQAAEILLED